jgi:hypothetical protein
MIEEAMTMAAATTADTTEWRQSGVGKIQRRASEMKEWWLPESKL